jgi:hypothetical protein
MAESYVHQLVLLTQRESIVAVAMVISRLPVAIRVLWSAVDTGPIRPRYNRAPAIDRYEGVAEWKELIH